MPTPQRQSDGWIERAPHRLSASREIAASPTEIWAVLADHESWPEWFTAVQGVTITGAAAGVGARRRVHLRGLDVDEEFVAWDIGERFAFTAIGLSRGIFESLNERVTIEQLGEDGPCLVTYTQAFAPKWWFEIPFRLVRREFRRGLRDGLDGLAARVE